MIKSSKIICKTNLINARSLNRRDSFNELRNYKYLTPYKVYDVYFINESYITIIDDSNQKKVYPIENFYTESEWREMQLSELLHISEINKS